MSKRVEDGPVLVSAATKLEEDVYTSLKLKQARSKRLLRDIYHEAFTEWVQRRKSLGEDADSEEVRRLYLAAPNRQQARRLSISIYEQYRDAMFRWAEKDGRAYCDALYSAIVSYLENTKKD